MKKTLLFLSIAVTINVAAQTPNWIWADKAGGSDFEGETAVAVDNTGNVYVTGNFRSPSITFGSFTLTNASAGSEDMFVVKYDSSGNVLWAKGAGSSGLDRVRTVTADASGNCYAAGTFNSASVTFGTTTLINASAGYDLFLVKYDNNGNVLWAKSAGGSSNEFANTLATDASGNCYAAGYFYSSTLTFGATTLTNSGAPDVFIVKYDSNGNALWAKSATGTVFGTELFSSVATDISGNCYAAGYFNYGTTVTFGSYTLTSAGNQDLFIVKYDGSGNVNWAKSEGATGYERATGVVVDNFGSNIYVSGSFDSDTLIIGSTMLNPIGSNDIFLVKYDAAGNALWAKSAGGIDDEHASSVTADASGNAYVTGDFDSPSFTVGSTTLNNAGTGSNDIFIVKYDGSGNALWAKSAGGGDNDNALSLDAGASGKCYVAGNFESSSVTFGTATLTNAGSYDIFIAKLDNSTTGVEENCNYNGIVIYPNPADQSIVISHESLKNEPCDLKIFDVIGREILKSEVRSQKPEIDVSKFENGIYFVQISTSFGVRSQKLIVQH